MHPKSRQYSQAQHLLISLKQVLSSSDSALKYVFVQKLLTGLLSPPVGGQVRSSQSQPMATSTRAHVVTRQDSLRTVVERLGVPGVRRLVVVDSSSRRLEGLISLSDIATYLFT